MGLCHSIRANIYSLSHEISQICVTGRFITAFTNAYHLSLKSARYIHSMPPSHFLTIHPNIYYNFIFPTIVKLFSTGKSSMSGGFYLKAHLNSMFSEAKYLHIIY
jgi:hypothetical protein